MRIAECPSVGRIAVLGSINMDLVLRVPALPRPGETVLGDRLLRFPGGKGANQATAAARLGAEVRMLGRVGSDDFGDELLRGLEGDRVDVSGVSRETLEPSGAALILVEESGQNVVAVAPGGNSRVGEDDVLRLVAGLAPGDVVVLQLEVPQDAVRAAAEGCRKAGATVVLNAAPIGPSVTRSSLPEVDILVVNEGEAAALSGLAVAGVESAEAAAAVLSSSARAVVVTLGAAGAILWEGRGARRFAAHKVRVVDATAAGDAFVGAIAYALAAGATLAEAVELGGAAGAIAVSRMGARSSLPTLDEVQRLLGSKSS
jgi:ribokinase